MITKANPKTRRIWLSNAILQHFQLNKNRSQNLKEKHTQFPHSIQTKKYFLTHFSEKDKQLI